MVNIQEHGGMHGVPDGELERFARGQVTFTEWNRFYRRIRKEPGALQRVQELLGGIADEAERRRILELHESLRENYEKLKPW